MSDFSDYLSNYIKEQNLTLKAAANFCNQNYSLMSRFASGNRIPSNISIVEHIADALLMQPSEKETLINLYYNEKMGADVWEAFLKFENILKRLDHIINASKQLFPKVEYAKTAPIDTPIMPLASQQQLFDAISYSLVYFSDMERIPVYAIMQPNAKMSELLINHSLASKISLQLVICFDQNNHNSPLTNLDIFDKLLPLLCSPISPDVRYYYESIHNHINTFSIFPFLIIIGNYAIRFNSTLSNGELTTIPEQVNFFKEHFDKINKQTHPLTNKLSTGLEHSYYLGKNEACHNTGYGIHPWPCIGFYLSEDIYEKFILPDLPYRQQMIETLTQKINYNISNKSNHYLTSIMTKEGFKHFMSTGIILEFPLKYYTPLTMPYRKLILSRMVESIKNGWGKIFLAKDDITLPQNIGIALTESCISFKNITTPDIDTLTIHETTLCKLLANYIEYCIEIHKVYSQEETLEYIESFL